MQNTHHYAYAARDLDGRPYLVLQPRDGADARLTRQAYEMHELSTAQRYAGEFNAGSAWAFNGRHPLTGSDIPRLRRSFSDWKVYEIPYGSSEEQFVQDKVADRHMAITASTGAIPQAFALFSRSVEFRTTILLLGPEAAKWAQALPGVWSSASDDVGEHGWDLLFGDASSWEKLGLQRPRIRAR